MADGKAWEEREAAMGELIEDVIIGAGLGWRCPECGWLVDEPPHVFGCSAFTPPPAEEGEE